jgi:hypothetical protein
MSEPGHGEVAQALLPEHFDCARQIASLRETGACLLDPVGFHYLEVLSARAEAHQGRVKSILENKLALALADFRLRLAQVQAQAQVQQPTQSIAEDRLVRSGITVSQGESLAELVRSMAQVEPERDRVGQHEAAATRPELKSVRLFRSTWSKLSADKQLNAALDKAPRNAGPINSHMLVLRSLALMRDISPDYLNRFISYADTLVHLEQGEKPKTALPKTVADGAVGKKAKVRRPRASQSGSSSA